MYKKEAIDARHCLECGDKIEYGRSDKKFCCEACKNIFNNRRAHAYRMIHMRVMGILDRNHDILEHLIRTGVRSIDIGDLSQMGYNCDYATSFYRTRHHQECRCFDIKYFISDQKVFNIEKVLPLK